VLVHAGLVHAGIALALLAVLSIRQRLIASLKTEGFVLGML
jgi:hypothetical protein